MSYLSNQLSKVALRTQKTPSVTGQATSRVKVMEVDGFWDYVLIKTFNTLNILKYILFYYGDMFQYNYTILRPIFVCYAN
jgi:hypothetical protein